MAQTTLRARMPRALALAFVLAALAVCLRGWGPWPPSPRSEAALAVDLEVKSRQAYARAMAKVEFAVDVSRGRMGLLEAAAGCLALSRDWPTFDWEGFRSTYAGDSDEERHCRYVIDMAAALLRADDPRLGDALRARLERELEGHLRRGPLSLPRPRPAHCD
jgi:hypothetical protein